MPGNPPTSLACHCLSKSRGVAHYNTRDNLPKGCCCYNTEWQQVATHPVYHHIAEATHQLGLVGQAKSRALRMNWHNYSSPQGCITWLTHHISSTVHLHRRHFPWIRFCHFYSLDQTTPIWLCQRNQFLLTLIVGQQRFTQSWAGHFKDQMALYCIKAQPVATLLLD